MVHRDGAVKLNQTKESIRGFPSEFARHREPVKENYFLLWARKAANAFRKGIQ
jgi:hypothetical protein